MANLLPRPASCPEPFLRLLPSGVSPASSPKWRTSYRSNASFRWSPSSSRASSPLKRTAVSFWAHGVPLKLLGNRTFLTLIAVIYLTLCLVLPLALHTSGSQSTLERTSYLRRQRIVPVANPTAPLRRSALETKPRAYLRTVLEAKIHGTQEITVDYREAGFRVPLQDALNASAWQELQIYNAGPLAANLATVDAVERYMYGGDDTITELPSYCPQGPVRIFVGITTRCCTPSARAKRHAIRESWFATLRKDYGNSMSAVFLVSQPSESDDASIFSAASFLKDEISQIGDMAVLPGPETYHSLPTKTLELLRFALSSPCRFTHILKTDDDVYLRPHKLLQAIMKEERQWEMDIQAPPDLTKFDGRPGPNKTSIKIPWMEGMYLGKLDNNKTGIFPGWDPNRTVASKWYVSEETLPDADSPLGVRWASGWGYLLSRDLATHVWNTAVRYAMSPLNSRPSYWGKLPWEDVLVASLLNGVAPVSHHAGFKAAWDGCDEDTVLKHLDNEAPGLTPGLAAQEVSGLWDRKEVVCSSGPFEPNNYEEWRVWRNTLPDNLQNGFM